jgi:hypothetical protein
MIGRFYVFHEGLEFLHSALAELLGDSVSEDRERMLQSVIDYLGAVLLHVPFAETLAEMPEWSTTYDVDQWRAEHFQRPLEKYHLTEPYGYLTSVSPDTYSKITTRVSTFGEHPAGLGKFTRTMFAQDLRRSVTRKNGRKDMGVSE